MEWGPWLSDLTKNWLFVLTGGALAIFAVSLLAYVVLARAEAWAVRRWARLGDLHLIRRFFWPNQLLLFSLALGLAPVFLRMPADVVSVVRGVAKVGTVVAVMLILLRTLRVVMAIWWQNLRVDHPDNFRQRRLRTQLQYVEKVLDVLIVFVAISAVLLSFEGFRRFGGSMLASAGLASLIVGFAAQRSLANLIAGLQIAFTQPIRLGDAVFVENEWGEIEEITLTYVVVRIWDLRRLVLPITYFIEKPFQNWTRNSAELLGQVVLYADYSLPVDEIRAEFMRLLRQSPLWDGKVGVLQVVDFSERCMTLRGLMSARNSGQAFDLRCEIREKLIRFIQDHHAGSLPKARVESLDVREGIRDAPGLSIEAALR